MVVLPHVFVESSVIVRQSTRYRIYPINGSAVDTVVEHKFEGLFHYFSSVVYYHIYV